METLCTILVTKIWTGLRETTFKKKKRKFQKENFIYIYKISAICAIILNHNQGFKSYMFSTYTIEETVES